MTYFVNVTSQGQMSIPASIRRALGIQKKKKVIVRLEKGKMIVSPVSDILDFEGIFKTNKKIPFRVTRKAFEEALGRGEV